jgi:hypothetical protein
MKKTTKNPITFFREANEKRQATVKNSLKKAQDGMVAGPYEEGTAKYLDTKYPGTAMKFIGPVDPSYEADQRDKVARPTSFGWDRTSKLEAQDRSREEESLRSPYGDFNTGMGLTESDAYKRGGRVKKPMMKKGGSIEQYKKGGSAKPSAGLSKKTKSNIAKKASAGKDIGKKGKGFAKVAAAAGGGEKGKRIAAAAMWKNVKRG